MVLPAAKNSSAESVVGGRPDSTKVRFKMYSLTSSQVAVGGGSGCKRERRARVVPRRGGGARFEALARLGRRRRGG